jgi:hypothetical protein
MDIAKLSCRVGLHKWTPWAINETSLEASDPTVDLAEFDDIRIEDQERECSRCHKTEIRTLLCW